MRFAQSSPSQPILRNEDDMSEVQAKLSPAFHTGFTLRHDAERMDNPARAFANGIALALPLWGVICAVIWSLV